MTEVDSQLGVENYSPMVQPEMYVEDPQALEVVLDEVRKYVENYFAENSFLNDQFVSASMSADGFIPLTTLSALQDIQAITTNIDIIGTALSTSPLITFDETGSMVKPLVKQQRSTVILRGISGETSEQEIEEIFNKEGAPGKVASVRSDIGDTWFVSFETEEIALATLPWLREQKFKDKAIRARIKNENTPVATFYQPQVAQNNYYQQPQQINTYVDPNYRGQMHYNQNYSGGWNNQEMKNNDNRDYRNNHRYNGRGGSRYGGRGGKEGYRKEGTPNSPPLRTRNNSGGKRNSTGRGSKKNDRTSIQLGVANFPPLPTVGDEIPFQSNNNVPSGYTTDFRQYNKEEIMNIIAISAFENLTKPQNLIECDAVCVVNDPNTEFVTEKPQTTTPISPNPVSASSSWDNVSDKIKAPLTNKQKMAAKNKKKPASPKEVVSQPKKETSPVPQKSSQANESTPEPEPTPENLENGTTDSENATLSYAAMARRIKQSGGVSSPPPLEAVAQTPIPQAESSSE